MSHTFTRTWYDVNTTSPKESGRYLVIIEELNDLGVSYIVWNCYYDKNDNKWSDNQRAVKIIYWTELPDTTFVRDKNIKEQILNDYNYDKNKLRAKSLANDFLPVKPMEKYDGNLNVKFIKHV